MNRLLDLDRPGNAYVAVRHGHSEANRQGLVVSDPANDFFIHRVVTGIAPTDSRIEEGSVPVGATEGPNSEGGAGWVPPCPGEGEIHTYDFTVYAFSEAPTIEPGMTALETVGQLDTAASQRTVMTASAEAAA